MGRYVFQGRDYVIEQCEGLPKEFALDYKYQTETHTHLINIGWYDTVYEAYDAMAEHTISNDMRPVRVIDRDKGDTALPTIPF